MVVVVVEACSPVTGNHARRLCRSTSRDNVGPMNPVVADSGPPYCSRHGTGADERPYVSGDVPLPLGGDAPLTKVSLLPRAKILLLMRLQAKVQRAWVSISW